MVVFETGGWVGGKWADKLFEGETSVGQSSREVRTG